MACMPAVALELGVKVRLMGLLAVIFLSGFGGGLLCV